MLLRPPTVFPRVVRSFINRVGMSKHAAPPSQPAGGQKKKQKHRAQPEEMEAEVYVPPMTSFHAASRFADLKGVHPLTLKAIAEVFGYEHLR